MPESPLESKSIPFYSIIYSFWTADRFAFFGLIHALYILSGQLIVLHSLD